MFDEIHLYEEKDRLVFIPHDECECSLIVNRKTGEVTSKDEKVTPPAGVQPRTVYGVAGVLELVSGEHVIVVTARTKIGELEGSPVYRVDEFDVLQAKSVADPLTPKQATDDSTYLELVHKALNTDSFYFSPSYDLTNTFQRHEANGHRRPSLKTIDHRWFWNEHMQGVFVENKWEQWVFPMVLGFMRFFSTTINDKTVEVALLSRRSHRRAGTRYIVRGLDHEGNVANYVETEQVVRCGDHVGSYVQIRGSIPLFWSQRVNLKYKPKPLLLEVGDDKAVASFRTHVTAQTEEYGHMVMISLVNLKGSEGALAAEFERVVDEVAHDMVRLVAFDFHTECKNMRYDRLSKLRAQVEGELGEYGFFTRTGATVHSTQRGVFRTNCMDCLDRTNVVQTLFAREVASRQLRQFGTLGESEAVDTFADFETHFKHMWADNADRMSEQYSGTGALKNDFTRTGQRSFAGLLHDGYKSLMRYYLNNFRDGDKQDAFDLVLGVHTPGPAAPSPFESKMSVPAWMLLNVLLFCLFMVAVLVFQRGDYSPLLVPVFLIVAVLCLQLMCRFGTHYVNKPRLRSGSL